MKTNTENLSDKSQTAPCNIDSVGGSCFFIERTKDNQWLEDAVRSEGKWTNDPHKAIKFKTKKIAEGFYEANSYPLPEDWALMNEIEITEHEFVAL